MWFRFTILLFCCVAVTKCSAENSTHQPIEKYQSDNLKTSSEAEKPEDVSYNGEFKTPYRNEERNKPFAGGDGSFSQFSNRPVNTVGSSEFINKRNNFSQNNGDRFPQNNGDRFPQNSGDRFPQNNGDRFSQNNRDRFPQNNGDRFPQNNGDRFSQNNGDRFPQNNGRPTNTDSSGHNVFSSLVTHQPIEHNTAGKKTQNEEATLKIPTQSFQNQEYTSTLRPSQFPNDKNQVSQRETERPHSTGTTWLPETSHQYEPEYHQEENQNQYTNNTESPTPDEEKKEVCFRNVGCFSMLHPWKSVLRPVYAPFSPEKILTKIFFYSRQNIDKQKNITIYPEVDMGEARFDSNKLTAIIVHGFANSGNATWMKDMKNAYLKQVDANIMLVDWGKGAQLWSYLQVAGNTRVVGKQLGIFVKYLIDHYGANPGKFHLIGHSLGAQICSYLAKDVPGIARLTALDPAQPGFEGFSKEVRLDKSDAEFVDVVHTDARPFIPTLGFGMIAPHGHVDFYMNGGFDQPGCVPPPKKELPTIKNILDLAKYPVELIAKMVACPHGRAYQYLTEAFNETEKCIFWGHKADVTNVLKSVTNTVTQGTLKKFVALSTTCSKENCIPLGFVTKKSPLRGSFVITTGAREPFCLSEPGIPPESPPEQKQESFIQKIAKRT